MNCIFCQQQTSPMIESKDTNLSYSCLPCNIEYFYLEHSYHMNIYVKKDSDCIYYQCALPPYEHFSNAVIKNDIFNIPFTGRITPNNVRDKLKLIATFM